MKFSKLLIITASLLSISTVNAEVLKGCAAKKQDIETQLKYAQSRGNTHEIKGLEKALKENIAKCNDSSLKYEREQKVLEKQRKVSKLELELQKEKEKGDARKIMKKQTKLQNAQQELKEAKSQLSR
ncbi:MAG: DUF1090 domain-containing protein [Acinetobacter sp.]|jgi:hypothetical protein